MAEISTLIYHHCGLKCERAFTKEIISFLNVIFFLHMRRMKKKKWAQIQKTGFLFMLSVTFDCFMQIQLHLKISAQRSY